MNKQQASKILKVLLVATGIILGFEILFFIPTINNFFCSLITNSNGWLVYLVIWCIMFLQVTVLNIPAYVILSASVSIGINTLSITYILVVISAYMSGCILAYWLGRKFGVKAIKWCAGGEEDYNKWSAYINNKGKWFYFLTVLLPFFPDDILCLVAGSVKFNFVVYTIANAVGRTIGLVAMLLTMKLLGIGGGGFPFMIIVWAVALIGEFVAYILIKNKGSKNNA